MKTGMTWTEVWLLRLFPRTIKTFTDRARRAGRLRGENEGYNRGLKQGHAAGRKAGEQHGFALGMGKRQRLDMEQETLRQPAHISTQDPAYRAGYRAGYDAGHGACWMEHCSRAGKRGGRYVNTNDPDAAERRARRLRAGQHLTPMGQFMRDAARKLDPSLPREPGRPVQLGTDLIERIGGIDGPDKEDT